MSRHSQLSAAMAALTLTSLGAPAPAAVVRHHLRHSVRPIAPVAQRLKPPPESYLEYKVYTKDQLIQQIRDNAVVRRRFARHFQIPESRVASYMSANLQESYIQQTRRYTVYCVSRTGKFFPIRQTFQKGTKVFALRNGQPLLKWLCGNPLSRFLPSVETKTYRKPFKVARSLEVLVTPAEATNVVVPTESALGLVVPATIGSGPADVFSAVGSAFNALYLLPAALLFSNAGHGGGGTTPYIPPPSPEIPEPSGAVYVLAALPVVALAAVRRRRSLGTKPSV